MGDLIQLDVGKKVRGWIIDKKLGEGAFGAVYKCSNAKGDLYALKVEGKDEKIQLLKMEVFVLAELAKSGGRHFCKIEDKGQVDNFNYVVMTFVGLSLADLKAMMASKKFSYGTAISVGRQSLEALEDLHSIGYLHRDVKPGNYTIGRAELGELRKVRIAIEECVYVLDFGMARKFVHEDGTIKKPRNVAGFRGTVKYAPVSCHAGRELCRLDDCETWVYMLVELTKGSLPWKNMTDIKQIGQAKRECRMSAIGSKRLFGGCPREYIDMLKTIDGGQFFAEPDYPRLYYLLKQAMNNCQAVEYPYDWEKELNDKMQKDKEEKERLKREGPKKEAKKPTAPPEKKAEKKPEVKPKKEEEPKEIEKEHAEKDDKSNKNKKKPPPPSKEIEKEHEENDDKSEKNKKKPPPPPVKEKEKSQKSQKKPKEASQKSQKAKKEDKKEKENEKDDEKVVPAMSDYHWNKHKEEVPRAEEEDKDSDSGAEDHKALIPLQSDKENKSNRSAKKKKDKKEEE